MFARVYRNLVLLGIVEVIVISLVSFSCANDDRPVIETKQGIVRGIYKNARNGRPISAFLKIPFAQPPVGKLRLRSPMPASRWTGIRDASKDGPPCPQKNGSVIIGDEDCLYLNVYVPHLPNMKTLIPVMYFIHGGALITGECTSDIYGPQYLLDKDVILVASNYRLGRLGFASFEDTVIPGNWGLKDQLMALKWIREYISDYGGNPGSVTIFGQSAGAVSANLHLIVPASKGLFHRVITESGSAINIASVSHPGQQREKTEFFAKKVNCFRNNSYEMLDCFQSLTTEKFFLNTFWEIYITVRTLPFSRGIVREPPEVTDAFLTENPYFLLTNPSSIPWMSGINTADAAFLSNYLYSYIWPVVSIMDVSYEYIFPLLLSYRYTSQNALVSRSEITTALIEFYFKNKFILLSFNEFTDMLTDRGWLQPLIDSAHLYSGPKFVYYFDYANPALSRSSLSGTQKVNGPSHGDELAYIFYDSKFQLLNLPAVDLNLSKQMVEFWTNFAINGTPNSNNANLIWKPVTSLDVEYLHITRNATMYMNSKLRNNAYRLWDSFDLEKDF